MENTLKNKKREIRLKIKKLEEELNKIVKSEINEGNLITNAEMIEIYKYNIIEPIHNDLIFSYLKNIIGALRQRVKAGDRSMRLNKIDKFRQEEQDIIINKLTDLGYIVLSDEIMGYYIQLKGL